MDLCDDELEIALLALRHTYRSAMLAATRTPDFEQSCCLHVAEKCQLLIDRIEQQQDDINEEGLIEGGP